MQYQMLPQLNEKVSKICLGTMTWGQQNTETQAHEQMDMALSEGVNFWDTAEMYPSPPDKDKQGDTERFMVHGLIKPNSAIKLSLLAKYRRWIFCVMGKRVLMPNILAAPSMAIFSVCRPIILIFTSSIGLNASEFF